MRNYWSLLPAVAVVVVLLGPYAVPTLVNPQWTATVLGLFRQEPGEDRLSPRRLRSHRMLAGLLVVVALALIGFNVGLNREANGCYRAARAFGAVDRPDADTGRRARPAADPCVRMIYGSFFGDGSGGLPVTGGQPVENYQLVDGSRPAYLRWIQNRPAYDDADLLIGVAPACALDLRVDQAEDRVTVVLHTDQPCPDDDEVSLTSVQLAEPLGDRRLVTAGNRPMRQIEPDLDSWPTVLLTLATGG